jgi:dUTP pyrophosphatase
MYIELKITNKEFYEEFSLPKPATKGSAAVDLYATEDFNLTPGSVYMMPTGLAININPRNVTPSVLCDDNGYLYREKIGLAGLLLPRSGAGHRGLVLGNTVGLIDSDYQGELKISCWNRLSADSSSIDIKRGDRVAQLMFVPIVVPEWKVVEEFTTTSKRGVGGFGSTGK